MSSITLFGISNCDTVKKARRWLEQRGLDYHFHDFRKDGLTPTRIRSWLDVLAWEEFLNKRGRTWRELSDAEKQISNASQAVSLYCKYPTLIKRPVLVSGKQILVGFDTNRYASLLTT